MVESCRTHATRPCEQEQAFFFLQSRLTTCIADDVCQKKPDLSASPPTGNGSEMNFMVTRDRWRGVC